MDAAISILRAAENPEPEVKAFYRQVLDILLDSGVPFLVGGAYAFNRYTGINRHTKDLDIFIRRDDFERVGLKSGTRDSRILRCSNCSARPPRSSSREIRATDCSSTRSSCGICSRRRTKMPPGLSSNCASSPDAIRPVI